MKTTIISLLALLLLISCSETKRLIRKAEISTGQMHYQKALAYYDKVLEKDNDSYRANAGKGIVLSEFMEQHDNAIPYLEKALMFGPKDTLVKIHYNLGKGYHHLGNYNKALYHYRKIIPHNNIEDKDYDAFLDKRISDCKYALGHAEIEPHNEQNIKNIGNIINSEYSEYAAVSAGNNLFFTSRKKDDEKEKVNGWDGKYFESIYVSSWENEAFSVPERYTIPSLDEKSKFQKYNEAVISISSEEEKMFIYRDGKIYESNLNDPTAKATEMDRTINFSRFQNHAAVSGNGNILFFTSESKDGKGGTDIFQSVKNINGQWSAPILLDTTIINTPFNEESPFYAENGTLYFSSNGLPGYGGYDVYKTRLVNGKWTIPQNLGQPVNSPGDDLFFTLKKNSPDGYYSSNRTGGFGDMDIYHVHYVSNEIPDCQSEKEHLLTINFAQSINENPAYYIMLKLPDEYSKNIRSYTWTINDSLLADTAEQFQYRFNSPGNYKLAAKVLLYCDTCPSMMAMCTEKTIIIEDTYQPLAENLAADITENDNYLSSEELKNIDWDISPIYFDYNEYLLKENAVNTLNQNIEVLKNHRNFVIEITGYTDSRGSSIYNMELSAKRVNSVRRYLLSKGISDGRIIATYSLGESKLANNCSDYIECEEQQHQLNRRVEINVMENMPAKILTGIQK